MNPDQNITEMIGDEEVHFYSGEVPFIPPQLTYELQASIVANLGNEKNLSRTVYEVDPRETIAAPNVRPMDPEHIIRLAIQINSVGQINACTADMTEAGMEIIGGRHRRASVIVLNQVRELMGIPLKPLIVSAFNEPLDPLTRLQVQIGENLNKPMTKPDEAYVIDEIFRVARATNPNITLEQLSAMTGRSPSVIREATTFVNNLSPNVRNLVLEGALSFSKAMLIAELEYDPENGIDKQTDEAVKAVLMKLKPETIAQRVKELKAKTSIFADGLFSLYSEADITALAVEDDRESLRISTHANFKQSSLAARQYLNQFEKALKLAEQTRKIDVTRSSKDLIADFIFVAGEFQQLLQTISPEVHEAVALKISQKKFLQAALAA